MGSSRVKSNNMVWTAKAKKSKSSSTPSLILLARKKIDGDIEAFQAQGPAVTVGHVAAAPNNFCLINLSF